MSQELSNDLRFDELSVGEMYEIAGDDFTYEAQVLQLAEAGPVMVFIDLALDTRQIVQLIGTIPFSSSPSYLVRELILGIVGIGDHEGDVVFTIHGVDVGGFEMARSHVNRITKIN